MIWCCVDKQTAQYCWQALTLKREAVYFTKMLPTYHTKRLSIPGDHLPKKPHITNYCHFACYKHITFPTNYLKQTLHNKWIQDLSIFTGISCYFTQSTPCLFQDIPNVIFTNLQSLQSCLVQHIWGLTVKWHNCLTNKPMLQVMNGISYYFAPHALHVITPMHKAIVLWSYIVKSSTVTAHYKEYHSQPIL